MATEVGDRTAKKMGRDVGPGRQDLGHVDGAGPSWQVR